MVFAGILGYWGSQFLVKKDKSRYLSARVFSTVVLVVDTVNKQTNIVNRTEMC